MLQIHDYRMSFCPHSDDVNWDVLFPIRLVHCDHGSYWTRLRYEQRGDHVDQCIFSVSSNVSPDEYFALSSEQAELWSLSSIFREGS